MYQVETCLPFLVLLGCSLYPSTRRARRWDLLCFCSCSLILARVHMHAPVEISLVYLSQTQNQKLAKKCWELARTVVDAHESPREFNQVLLL
jgi:hypothetical protein